MTQIQGITSSHITPTPISAPVVKLSGIEKVINHVKTFFKNGAVGAVHGYNTVQKNYTVQKISLLMGILATIFRCPPSYISSSRIVSELKFRFNDTFETTGVVKETSAWCGAIIGAFKGSILGNRTEIGSVSFDNAQNNNEKTTTDLPADKAIPTKIESNLLPLSKQNGKVTKFIDTYFKNATTGAETGNWLGQKVGLLVGLADVFLTTSGWIRDSQKAKDPLYPHMIAGLVLTPLVIGAEKGVYGALGTIGGAAVGSIAHAVRRREEKDTKPQTDQPERA